MYMTLRVCVTDKHTVIPNVQCTNQCKDKKEFWDRILVYHEKYTVLRITINGVRKRSILNAIRLG